MSRIKEKARANLNFPKDGGVKPQGLSDVGVDEQVTIVLRGKLTGVSTSEWDGSRHFDLVLTSCTLHGKQVKVSLDDALKQGERKR